MKLVVVKTYPVYTVKTITNNGLERLRYSYDARARHYESLDGRSRSINDFGAEMDNISKHYFDVLRAYEAWNKAYTNDPTCAEKAINAFPQYIPSLIDRAWNARELCEFFAPVSEKISAEYEPILAAVACGQKSLEQGRREMWLITNTPNPAELAMLKDLNSTSLYAIWEKAPTLFHYIFKVYCRSGIMEMGSSYSRGFFTRWINDLDAIICTPIDRGNLTTEEVENLLSTANEKWDMMRYLSFIEPQVDALVDKTTNLKLANKAAYFEKCFVTDKVSDFTFHFLRCADDFRQAGAKWHNCLGTWGMDKSINENHVVAEITYKDGRTFVAGMRFSDFGSFCGYSYTVYDCNNCIEQALRDKLTKFLSAI